MNAARDYGPEAVIRPGIPAVLRGCVRSRDITRAWPVDGSSGCGSRRANGPT
jgi:hypothetical protein